LPHGVITGPGETDGRDVDRVGIKVGEIAHEPRGEVLVEEELQRGRC
jgi:hypothetical protein